MRKRLLASVVFGLVLSAPMFAEERQAISKVPPEYPLAAKQLRISGDVKIEAQVEEDGAVASAKAISGNMILTKPAVAAVMKWKFKPGPKAPVTVTVSFAL